MICAVLAAKLYVIANALDIEKQYQERYSSIQTKLHQYKYYGIGEISKHKIKKEEKSKDKICKHYYLATFRNDCQCCDIKRENMILGFSYIRI